MRALIALTAAVALSGCATVANRPVLRSALIALGAAVVVGEVGQMHGVSPAPAPAQPARPPAPFNPCSGSNLCAK